MSNMKAALRALSAKPPTVVPSRSDVPAACPTKVYTLPMALRKTGNTAVLPGVIRPSPTADAQAPVVTVKPEKAPPFAFASPTVGGKPLVAFGFLGYANVKAGEAPAPGVFATANDVRPKYSDVKNGAKAVYADYGALSTYERLNPQPVPTSASMVALGGTWGDSVAVPNDTLVSNARTLFNLKSFQEACDLASEKIAGGAAGAVRLFASSDRVLTTESALMATQPCYDPNLDKYLVLINHPECKYSMKVVDVETPETGPLTMTLAWTGPNFSYSRAVQCWPSTLEEAGVTTAQLKSETMLLFVDASLDPFRNERRLWLEAMAAPPPDGSKYIAFGKSEPMKAHFNDTVHDAKKAKKYNKSAVDNLLVNEERAVPVLIKRAGFENALLLSKKAVINMVKTHESTIPAVRQASDEVIANAVASLDDDRLANSVDSLTALAEKLMEALPDDLTRDVQSTVKWVFVKALLNAGTAIELTPLVFGWRTASGDGEESDFEGDDDDMTTGEAGADDASDTRKEDVAESDFDEEEEAPAAADEEAEEDAPAPVAVAPENKFAGKVAKVGSSKSSEKKTKRSADKTSGEGSSKPKKVRLAP